MEDEPLKGLAKEAAERREDAAALGALSPRSSDDGHVTRHTKFLAIPFSVMQGNEATCAYVTLSNVVVNIIAFLANIQLSYAEKMKLYGILAGFPIRTDVQEMVREVSVIAFPKKEFTLIVLFFYFFDWLKSHKMKAEYPRGVELHELTEDGSDFNEKIKEFFGFLQLKTKRLGGPTFTASGWIDKITTELAKTVGTLKWKKTALRTRLSMFGSKAATFTAPAFQRLCRDIIRPLTNKGIKIVFTVRGDKGQHDVMLIGIEDDKLLISNSWGARLDQCPMGDLPLIRLQTGHGMEMWWWAFQFTFYLPMRQDEGRLEGLKPMYDLSTYEEFSHFMTTYCVIDLPIKPLDFSTLTLLESDKVGGTRQKRRNKSKRRNKKTVSRV